jgi:saccharopine dehydrogenase-like NADP-dependent oxidoreductase
MDGSERLFFSHGLSPVAPAILLQQRSGSPPKRYHVILTSRSREKLEGLPAKLKGKVYTSETAALEASDPNATKALIVSLSRHTSRSSM